MLREGMMLLDELNSTQSLLLRGINDVEEHLNNNSRIATSLSNSSTVVYNLTVNSSEVSFSNIVNYQSS